VDVIGTKEHLEMFHKPHCIIITEVRSASAGYRISNCLFLHKCNMRLKCHITLLWTEAVFLKSPSQENTADLHSAGTVP